jgi:hypothetical protein
MDVNLSKTLILSSVKGESPKSTPGVVPINIGIIGYISTSITKLSMDSICGIPEELEAKNCLMILNLRGITEQLFNSKRIAVKYSSKQKQILC